MGRKRGLGLGRTAIAVCILLTGATACGDRSAPDTVHPLEGPGTTHPGGPTEDGAGVDAADPAPETPNTIGTPPPTRPEGTDTVDALLARYDRALTDMSADPDAAADPLHPLRIAWHSVVTPGTLLAEDLPAAIAGRARDGVVIGPGPEGLSYRHRALHVAVAADGTIGFTWCGWSPGIGRDRTTGAVVDDGVGHAHGTGRARQVADGWALDALDQTDLVVLPPGTDDPCDSEAIQTRDSQP